MYTNGYRTLLQALIKLTQYKRCLCLSFPCKSLLMTNSDSVQQHISKQAEFHVHCIISRQIFQIFHVFLHYYLLNVGPSWAMKNLHRTISQRIIFVMKPVRRITNIFLVASCNSSKSNEGIQQIEVCLSFYVKEPPWKNCFNINLSIRLAKV